MIRMILTLNAGSSSLKFSLFALGAAVPAMVAHGQVEDLAEGRRISIAEGAAGVREVWDGVGDFHGDALARVLGWLRAAHPEAVIGAVGHRVVHGGIGHDAPVAITPAVLAGLDDLVTLAPLHQPHNLAGIRAAQAAFADAVQVACFDTAFHRNHPFVNDVFALPRALYDQGVRRYGFHGLSYEFVADRLREIAPERADGRVIVAHLGNGASMCAIREGRSVASSMGFTALDGLPMGTRCGQLDPGVVLHLIGTLGMSVKAVTDLLYKESGLKGLSGVSHDMRTLLESDQASAAEAIDYFVFRIRREIGGLAAALEGVETLVFCGGIGENAAPIREKVLAGMGWLGIELDPVANAARSGVARVISAAGSRVRVYVIPTDEEAMIARHTLEVVGG